MAYQKAERKRVKLKIALTGPSGSGKTWSALEIAKGIAGPKGKIALADTENESASLYSDKFEFDTDVIKAPYETIKYIKSIESAVEAGYDVLIIDSITHAWAGEGGILDKKAKLDARGGNSYTNWKSLTPEQERFIATILNSDIHIICTMRSKQDYILQENEKGKQAPKKVGMAPVQRDGVEYEYTTVFDLDMSHHAVVSKDRTGLFDGKIFIPSPDTGKKMMKWLAGGKEPEPVKSPSPDPQSKATGTPPTENVSEPDFESFDENSEVPPEQMVIHANSKLDGLTFPEALGTQLGLKIAKWARETEKAHPHLKELALYAESVGLL